MYTTVNFKTKKALKEAVEAWNVYSANPALWELTHNAPSSVGAVAGLTPRKPRAVTYFQPGPFGGNEPASGTFCCEGPHYPQPHRWYATCTAENGVIVRVK